MASPRSTVLSGNNGVIRIGKEGNDTIMGSRGRDALYGGPGDDLIVGSPAPDRIFGNAGADTIDYSGLSAAISVDLETATVSGGDADGDQLVGIERVILTDHDDIATGDDADNRLEGRGGTDTLDGGNGNDTLIGGAGADRIRFGRESGRDRVVLDGSDTAIDVIQLGPGIAFDQLWYHRIGPDLAVSVLGTDAMIVVQDFFGKPARRTVSLRTEVGETLDATGLVALEAVLTGQTRPDKSQDRLPPALRHQLDPVLRTVWNGVPAYGMTKEVLANAGHTAKHQWRPAIAALAGGGYVVAWRDEAGQDGDGVGMFAQRFDKHGARVGKQFQANTYTESSQHWAAVTGLPDGGFVIVWMSFLQDKSRHGVFGQRFSADGSKVGAEFQAHTYTSGSQRDPTIASLSTGGFVIAWTSYAAQDGSSYGVFAQRFAADGTRAGMEFQVNTHTRDAQHRPVVAALADGGFVIVWESDKQDGDRFGIFGQRYAADGSMVGSEFQANTHTASIQNRPTVTGLAGGGFVVLWESLDQDGSGDGIYGQVFDKNGQAVGAEFRANSHTTSDQMRPAVTALDDGGFLAMWDSLGQNGSAEGIFGQRFAADGTRVGSEFQANSRASNLQANVEVATLGDGGIAAVWESEIKSNNYDITTRVLEIPPTLSDIGDADGNVLPASGTRPAPGRHARSARTAMIRCRVMTIGMS